MNHTYKITTKSPKINGSTVAALNNAAAIHEKKHHGAREGGSRPILWNQRRHC